jgi:site-specific DNA-cytosine methylase
VIVDGQEALSYGYGRGDHAPSVVDAPARAITTNPHGDGSVILANPPAPLSSKKSRVLRTNDKHPVNTPDRPSHTVTTRGDSRGGGQGAAVLEWPWNRPSTTVTTRAGLPPPGHHPESGSIMSQPNAVVLSERAAAILQGFPEDWLFAGKTKKARWSQIGQAMPPPLAYAVATSIARWLRGDHVRVVKEA